MIPSEPESQPRGLYRPDIDGLRALAVLGVILFHAGFEDFAGGFLGVDVFFVISGFLITGLIHAQVLQGRFRLRDFYLRRARRLLPALLATIIGTLGAACFFFAPLHLKDLAASALAASVSVSNIYFHRQSGYFDTDAIVKPLLHTWSLSVEEQFYLAWPAVLMLAMARLPRRWLPGLVAGSCLASWLLTQHFRTHTSAIFFLAPFRAFEFGFGAIMVWLVRFQPRSRLIPEVLLLLGLALILRAVVDGSTQRSFSDVNTVLPCIGAALVIHSGAAARTGWILRNRVAVAIGLISYSLYLVHWPIIVLAKYNHFEPFASAERVGLIAASMAAAAAMYFLVEKPFRRRAAGSDRDRDRRFLAGSIAIGVASMAAACAVWLDDGLLHRFPATIRAQVRPEFIEANKLYTWPRFRAHEVAFDPAAPRKVLIVGDSQGADFVNVLGEVGLLERVATRTVELDRQCQSLITLSQADFLALEPQDQATCRPLFDRWLEAAVELPKADVVVLAFQWYERGIDALPRALRALRDAGARRVAVVGRKSQGFSGADILLRAGTGPAAREYSARHRNTKAFWADAQLAALPRDFIWVDMMSRICTSPTSCEVIDREGNILFFDGSHFTPAGASEIGRRLLEGGALDFMRGP